MTILLNYRLVVIESPSGGTWEEARYKERYTRACLHDSILREEHPFSPHLLYNQADVLDDDARKGALFFNHGWRTVADKLIVYTDLGITEDMRRSIDLSVQIEQPIEYREIGWPPPLKTIYLAGPMEYAQNNGLDWRIRYEELLLEWLEIKCIVPNREESKIVSSPKDFQDLKKTNLQSYKEKMCKLKEMDLKFVQSVDAIVCRWSGERMAGTIGEAQHATFHAIPFYLVCKVDFSEIPGWMLACATEIFPSSACLLGFLADLKWGNKETSYE